MYRFSNRLGRLAATLCTLWGGGLLLACAANPGEARVDPVKPSAGDESALFSPQKLNEPGGKDAGVKRNRPEANKASASVQRAKAGNESADVALLNTGKADELKTDAGTQPKTPLGKEWIERGGQCAKQGLCVGIRVHLVKEKGQPVQNADWWEQQIAFTQRLFESIQVSFRTLSVEPLDAQHANLRTPEDRDALHRFARSEHAVDVFVVRRLGDIDRLGEQIRGVHWRHRRNIKHRWVIVSSIAMPGVLAHELGHFFALPHSTYKVSIMNKKPAPGRPPWAKRVFAPPELKKMAKHRDKMKKTGRLSDRRQD